MTPILAERSQKRGQPVGQTDLQPSPLNLRQLNVNFGQDLNRIQDQTYHRDVIGENRVESVYRGGKVAARKPEMFNESMNIDECIESLKAYFVGTNPNAAFLSSAALKRVKHIFRHDVCEWSKLKKWMELAFNRQGLKYETIHAKFLMREQHMDESFASYHEELWALCDEMTALRAADDVDPRLTEVRVINQFALGIHDRLVRSDVKRYVAQNRTSNICSIDVLETASDAARDHAVEELYTHTYRESVEFLSKRVEEKGTHTAKVKVANTNPQPERTDQSTPRESQHRRNRNISEQRQSKNYNGRHVERKICQNGQIVCFRCKQPLNISQGCRNQRVISGSKLDELSKSKKEKAGNKNKDTTE